MLIALTQRAIAALSSKPQPYDVHDTRLTGLLVRVHPSGHKVYVVQYARGKRYTLGRADLITLDDARAQARRILVNGSPTPSSPPTTMPTLETYLTDRYAPWVEAHRRDGAATVKRLRAACAGLLALPLDALTPAVVERWRTERLAKVAKATVNRDLVALRSCLTKAVEWDLLPAQPLASVKPLQTDNKGRVRYLSQAEEHRLRAALAGRNGHLRPMVLVSLNTGVRQGELFKLTWAEIDFPQRLLTVAAANAKSGRTRFIPLNDEALATLEEWHTPEATGLVFPSKKKRVIDNVQKAWSTVLKTAAITDFRWHDLRHTFASKLVMRGVSLAIVRELLGHASIEMTLRYAHLAPENLRGAVSVLDVREI